MKWLTKIIAWLAVAMLFPHTSRPAKPDPRRQLPRLQGVFAVRQIMAGRVQMPLLGELDGLTTLTQRVEIFQQGDQLSLVFQTCDLEIDSGSAFLNTIVPAAFLDALLPFQRTASLATDGPGALFQAPPTVELYGLELEDPENDVLPSDPEDPGVLDPDADGNPGLTLRVSGLLQGHMYIVQRLVSELNGDVLEDGDRVEGLIGWSVEQVVLGADNPILLMDSDTTPHPDPRRSRFTFVRIQPVWDCGEILANGESLFF